MIKYLGFCCLLCTLTATNAEIFSIYNDKESNSFNPRSLKKIKTFPHDSFEFAFPFFNDLFPLTGLNTKPKEEVNKNNLKEEKDLILDLVNPETPSIFDDKKKKKNDKDKLIISFTELFIPFQNHKNSLEKVKKNDIFEDLFSGFPFIDFKEELFDKHEKPSIKKHRLTKKKYDKSIFTSMNSSNLGRLLEKTGTYPITKRSIITRFEPKFMKSDEKITLFSKFNHTEEPCCSEHKSCPKGYQCTSHACKAYNDNTKSINENSSIRKSLLLDKTFLICVIPGLIGFGALIFGIEVLRRHNELVKLTPFMSQYNQVQTC